MKIVFFRVIVIKKEVEMARRILSLGIICLFVISIVSSAYCASCGSCAKPCAKPCASSVSGGDNGPLKKLGRGMANFLTFPFEIPYRIGETNKSDGPYAAFTYGFVKGLVMTGYRALIGTYEILSFPFPLPEGYKPIITDPEFFFEQETY